MGRRILILLLKILLLQTNTFAQVGLINGSFEKWDGSRIASVNPLCPSIDYFKDQVKILHAYTNKSDFIRNFPKSGVHGSSYIGLGSRGISGAEGVALRISGPLTAGKKYVVGFSVYKPTIYHEHYTDKFLYSVVDSYKYINEDHGYVSTVHNEIAIAPHVAGEWYSVSDTIIADGSEKYLLLFPPAGPTVDVHYYYLYDDVYLRAIDHSEQMEIYFGAGSSELTSQSLDKVQLVCSYLKANNFSSVNLTGFTDGVGSSKDNFELSRERAQAVGLALKNCNNNVNIKEVYLGESGANDNQEDFFYRKVTISVDSSSLLESHVEIPLDVRDSIIVRFDRDQKLRDNAVPYNDSIINLIRRDDSTNCDFVDKLMSTYGYIGLSQLGPDHMDDLAYLLLHSSVENYEKHKLALKKAALMRQCTPSLFCYLIDKTMVERGKPQIFGTQYYYDGDTPIFYDIQDAPQINVRRSKYGLGDFDSYRRMVESSNN